MTSETKVPMPNFSFLGDDVSYGYDEHDLRDYGDARASERDDFICRLIANDAYAMSFQTMGQYRSALLKAIATLNNPRAGETA